VRRGTPRKMQNPAAENRIICRGKSWALLMTAAATRDRPSMNGDQTPMH